MNYRLSRTAITAIRSSVVIALVLVSAVGSVADGQRTRRRNTPPNPKPTSPAVSSTMKPAFQGFPIDMTQTIDLEIDENTIAGFSNRERLEQIRDWLLFTVIADAGLTADATNKILFDLPSSRRGYMGPVASYEYGSTRSRVIGNGRIVVLLSQTNDEATRTDELAQVVDQHRKNLGALPSSMIVFDYTVDDASDSAQVTRRAELSAREFFTEAKGYFETRVSSLSDLERFMGQIDDVTYATLDNGTLVLGGRKVKGRTYRGIRVEEVAAIWQSEKSIRDQNDSVETFTKKLEMQFNVAWQTYSQVVNSLSRGDALAASTALEKLRGMAMVGTGFSQLIRANTPNATPVPAKVPYEAVLKIIDAYSGDLATYNRLVGNTNAIRDRQLNDLQQYRDDKFKDFKFVSASGFSLDPTYDFDGLRKNFKDELKPLLRAIAAEDPSLVSAQDITQIESAFAANDSKPFFLTLGKLRKAGLPDVARALQQMVNQRYAYQRARYDGELQGTEVGMVLFYTDLLAKLWAFDYIKSTPSRDIADFYGMSNAPISVAHKANIQSASATRLWFGPQNKGFQFAKNPSPSVLFSRVAARVYSASSDPYNPGVEVEANAASAAFLGWWDAHYDEIARYEPEYERLNEIMKWSVVIGWLNNADNLRALNFLSSVTVTHSNVFPEWVRRHPNLRFKEWDTIGFYPAGYKENGTETLPLLSWDFVRFGEPRTLSGGVSLAGRKTFSTRTPLTREVSLPDTVRRSDLNYARPPKGPQTPNSFSNVEGTNWRSRSVGPNQSELVAVAKKGKAFRDSATELKGHVSVKRTSTLNPEGMNVKTFAGNVEVSDLNISRNTNGFKVGARSRAMDTGHVIARRLSVAQDPEAFLKTAPDVEEAFFLKQGNEFVIKMRGSEHWLRVGFDKGSTNSRWDSRVAEFGNDAEILRLNWIPEQQARSLAQTGKTVRAASENNGVTRVDAFLADNKPVEALRALDEIAPTELSEPDRLLRRAVAQIARNRAQPAYENLRDLFNNNRNVDQLFDEFNARLRTNKLMPDGDQFLPVQDGQQITLVYRKRNLGKPLTTDEAKDLDLPGAYLFVEDNQGLGSLDWSPGMEARTLQQVLARDLGDVVQLPRGQIATFKPAFITDGGGPTEGATRTRTFRSVRGTKPGSPLRTSTMIPCVDSDDNDPRKQRSDDRSLPCAQRDDKDRPVYVVVAK